MATKILYRRREFLNPRQGMAALQANVARVRYRDRKTKKWVRYVEANLELSDCSRRVSLDFDCYSKNVQSRLDKLDKVIRACYEIKAAIRRVYK